MSKLSLDALKMRAEAVASEDLLVTISGGTENACHDGGTVKTKTVYTDTGSSLGNAILIFLDWLGSDDK